MSYSVNPAVQAVQTPPVEETQTWIRGRTFPDDKPLLDVAQAVLKDPPAQPLREHLARLVREDGAAGYTDVLGLPGLREAFAARLRAEYGGQAGPEHVAVTGGCNQAFCMVLAALGRPGDEVLLPLPYYFNHQMWVEMQGLRPVPLPFNEAAGGVPDPEAAASLINGRTRAIVLVTPNNPTGATYPAPVIERFYRLARDHGLALILDETYKDFRPDEGPAHGLFGDSAWPETLVQLYSFSKAYSLAGYRVGTLVCGGPLMAEIAKVADCLAICAPRIGQEAALFGLTELGDWLAGRRQEVQARRNALQAAFAENGPGYRLVSSGAFFAYVRHPFAGQDASQVARRLADEQNVLCLPGSTFGPGQEPYLRMAYANLPADQMATLGARLRLDAGG